MACLARTVSANRFPPSGSSSSRGLVGGGLGGGGAAAPKEIKSAFNY